MRQRLENAASSFAYLHDRALGIITALQSVHVYEGGQSSLLQKSKILICWSWCKDASVRRPENDNEERVAVLRFIAPPRTVAGVSGSPTDMYNFVRGG